MAKKHGEITVIMGYPGSGKTTFIAKNYSSSTSALIGRDKNGVLRADNLENALARNRRAIIECSIPTRAGRSEIIAKGKQYGIPVVCKWLTTSYMESMFNICWRSIDEFGKILTTEEILAEYRDHPAACPVGILNNYRRNFEEPIAQEGYAGIDVIPFKRETLFGKKKAVIFDYDGTLRESSGVYSFPTTQEDVNILPNRKEKLTEVENSQFLLLGVSRQSCIHKGIVTKSKSVEIFEHTNRLLEKNITWAMCPHRASDPPNCYCRKPNVGLGVAFIKRFSLSPSECIVVGNEECDKQFAENCGFQYKDQKEFFSCLS